MYSDDNSDGSEAANTFVQKLDTSSYIRVPLHDDSDNTGSSEHGVSVKMAKEAGGVMLKVVVQGETEHFQIHKFYRMRRFFKSYEGFYTGSLDLTGRHMSRFVSLHRKWNSYLKDLLPLTLCAREVTVTSDESHAPYTRYVFSDSGIWEDFRIRWRIPDNIVIDYSLLIENTVSVLKIIKANPTPRIQKLCLMDLPPELLDMVFQHTDLYRARLLSSTSRQLNRIGRPYIYVSRTLTFDLPMGFRNNIIDIGDHLQHLSNLAHSERARILETTEFLLSRPDLCQELRTVSMTNNWRSSSFERTSAQGFELSRIEGKFFAPIHREFMNILAISNNLVSIAFCSLRFRTDDIECLAKLHFLHTLSLQECHIVLSARAKLQSSDIEFPAVHNLRLWFSATTISMWHILPLCSNLRTLSVLSPCKFNISTPSPTMWSRCRFLPNLERLCMNHIDPASVISLAEALQTASDAGGLRLTHFKLHTRRGVTDADAHSLLDSIQGAPIKVLVLEGLAEAELPIFEKIADNHDKTLEALTLVRRSSDRQLRNRAVVWPHATWEYASHFSRLSKLQHFGWNSTSRSTSASTSDLYLLESGFSNELPLDISEDDGGCMDSLGLESLPFASHCPSLKTFKSDEDSSTVVLISRSNTGFISTKPLNHAKSQIRKKYDIEQWNPSTTLDHDWPHIIPKPGTIL
ncbi:hypothetical protein BDZ94DRAFT_1298978 [Collybia nuda]|uniref:F-box domain-containing protein n=1 Tax=Collybia nuda TaxID=64659 RepID=A0A9P5Y5W6_9AGAR|nr:hypothetical protein BDZ94DRAFT_1298978 [Collybia nuda]